MFIAYRRLACRWYIAWQSSASLMRSRQDPRLPRSLRRSLARPANARPLLSSTCLVDWLCGASMYGLLQVLVLRPAASCVCRRRVCFAGVHPERLYRVLRAAVNYRCLAVVRGVTGGEPRFRNSQLSSLLREDHPNSCKAIVRPCSRCASAMPCPVLRDQGSVSTLFVGAECMCTLERQVGHIAEDSWSAWGELAWAVRTGDSAFKKANDGKTIWEYLKVHMLCMLRSRLHLRFHKAASDK